MTATNTDMPCDMLVVIVSYRAEALTIDCLRSLEPEVAANSGVKVAVCENGTGPDAARRIQEAIDAEGWQDWVWLKAIAPNRGFTGGNNVILRAALEWPAPPRLFLLLNADTIVRPGAITSLLSAAGRHPEAGIMGPRLEWPDATPQESCFLDFSPPHELLLAARTGPLSHLFDGSGGTLPVCDVTIKPDWLSFACALIRREVLEQVGVLDEGFFLYFDDPDFCRRARRAGWHVLYWPEARVVHLRGRSNPVKSLTAQRKRRPAYWYRSRARYYAKYYGRAGLWTANLLWWAGRSVSLSRELLGHKQPHTCEREWLDIWTNSWNPLSSPMAARAG